MPTLDFATGFEHQVVTVGAAATGGGPIWDAVVGSLSISTTTFRTGAAALRVNPSASTAYVQKTISTQRLVGTVYVRFASLPAGGYCNLVVGNTGTNYLVIGVTTEGKWYADPGDTAGRITDSVGPNTGTWYRIE